MSSRTDYLAYLTAQGFTPNRAVLFEEGSGTPVEHYTATPVGVHGSPGWTTVSGFTAASCSATSAFWDIGASNVFLGTTKQTILLIRAKHDVTARASAACGLDSLSNRCGIHLPYSDGNVYWQFGSSNQSYAYTGATAIEAWAFRAGTLGSSIWKDGISVVSSGTLITRGSEATVFQISTGMGAASDLVDWLFFALIPDEVSDAVLATFTPDVLTFTVPEVRVTKILVSAVAAIPTSGVTATKILVAAALASIQPILITKLLAVAALGSPSGFPPDPDTNITLPRQIKNLQIFYQNKQRNI